jgi:hypothetical protein
VVEMLLYILLVRAGMARAEDPCGGVAASAPCAGVSVPGLVKSSHRALTHGLPCCATLAMRMPPHVGEAELEAATLAARWQRQGDGQSNVGASSSSLTGCQEWRWWAWASSSSPAEPQKWRHQAEMSRAADRRAGLSEETGREVIGGR